MNYFIDNKKKYCIKIRYLIITGFFLKSEFIEF